MVGPGDFSRHDGVAASHLDLVLLEVHIVPGIGVAWNSGQKVGWRGLPEAARNPKEIVMRLAKLLIAVSLTVLPALPGVAADGALPMTPIVFKPDGVPVATSQPELTPVAGSECPTGSGNYCSDELPYCCPGINVAPYCAADVNGCTQ